LKTNIDETKFPDDNFRNYLLEQDYGKDGVLTELFNGVIHPAAGLFEDYFDVDKAAEEHLADETTQGIVISNQKKTIRR
jgi:hypothetical protein